MKIEFEYQDQYSHGTWNKQTAICESVQQMIKFYGLNEPGVKYRIISITK